MSSINIFNMKNASEIIEGIKVTGKLKYLQITINNTRNYLKRKKQMVINKAQNTLMSHAQ